MADTRSLRITTAATFLPAFPLLLAHGVVANSPAPAVGLVPLAVSASTSIFLLSRQSARKQQSADPERGDVGSEGQVREQVVEQEPGLEQEFGQQPQERPEPPAPTSNRSHPILVFAVDTILAAALMVVLVFTWIDSSSGSTNSAESAMLAAYGTIPLLINFFIHLYLAVREFSRGLAIPGLTQYLAWQVVEPDCPDCGRRLRPDAPPSLPWVEETSLPRPNFKNVKFKLPSIPKVKAPEWKTPAWLQNRNPRSYLFGATNDDESITTPYRDDPEEGGPSILPDDSETVEPEVVDVVSKKSRKLGKDSSSSP
ncbi:uncharacterized protein GGS22DRAFT_73614 [Annulohypoxylon maeteangense]|uniref:uncharacterized protein n=1 Tax=Annulohypoxylon maeteangense TaxID=1927788 RepID=UPI0020075EF0|nr:uncharacterized protein GGS22DRAFT_73614 [Annulohypoxylon maeteangense]KAI0881320.1 hypothetical protein GGS22DRAFT_73614 [Annulohypoxylon maeteangense]